MVSVTYPQCQVRLQVFLETPPPIATSAPLLPPGFDDDPVVREQIRTLIAEPSPTHEILFQPMRVRVRHNSYIEADCCDVEAEYHHFPFDPRIAKAVEVAVFMRSSAAPGAADVVSPENLVFSGFADDGSWELHRRGNTISFTFRDHSALLIDRPWSGEQVDWTGKELRQILREILDASPSTARMKVVFRGVEDSQPGPGAARKPGEGSSTTGQTTVSTWDVLTGIVRELGLIAWIEDDTLVVGPSQTLTRGRVADVQSAPLFRWRENIERLKFRKKLSERAPVIQLRSYNPGTVETIIAQWPLSEPDKSRTGAGVPSPRRTVVQNVPFVVDKAELEKMARRLYERWVREDLVIRIETAGLIGLEGEDLRALRPGAPARVVINPIDDEFLTAAAEGRELTAEDYERVLRVTPSTEMNDAAVAAIAAAYRSQRNLGLFQVLDQELVFDHQDGIKMTLDLGSYIEAEEAQP